MVNIVRIIARFEKGNSARFVSHLDVQRLFQRAFRRAKVPAAYSQGFNPHQALAFATALSVGFTSSAEWLDLRLEGEMAPEDFTARVNEALPAGFRVLEAMLAEDALPALSAIMCAADYTVRFSAPIEEAALLGAVEALLSGAIVVNKKTKAGRKDVDIRPQLYKLTAAAPDTLLVTGEVSVMGSLNIDLMMEALFEKLGAEHAYTAHRSALYSRDGRVMPAYSDQTASA